MSRASTVRVILVISVLLGGFSLLGPVYGFSESWLFVLFVIYFLVYLAASYCIVGFRLDLQDEIALLKFEVQAEHLWTSKHDGGCYYGFK